MSLHGLGASVFDNYGPIVRYDGTPVTDPLNEAATYQDCLPYQCGADPANAASRFWCAFWGQSGFGSAKPCGDPACAPFKANVPGCNILAATVEDPNPVQPNVAPPMLTPANIVQQLPDITFANRPVSIEETTTSCWCAINQWINDNPLSALAILGVAAVVTIGRKGGR